MLGEPLLLGLLVAPSLSGVGIAMAAVFAFLARHPFKLAAGDWRSGRRTARTAAAERIALLFAGGAASGLALAARAASSWWLPLVAAAPLAVIQLAYDVRHKGRQLLPELLGGIALGSTAAAVVLAGGRGLPVAAALWSLAAAKAAAAILYVRARLRSDRDMSFSRGGVFSIHALGVLLASILAAESLAPWSAAAAFLLLLGRAIHGLSRFHRRVRPQLVGKMELAYGFAFVLFVALGYKSGP